MAKIKHFTPLSQMSKKDKFLHFLKIFGISFAGVMAMVAGVVIYVWATGGFNPPYVPLSSWAFSQAEYVIDGNKEIELDENGNQKYDKDGNLSFIQKKDNQGKELYEFVKLVPNENCTELDAEIKLSYSSYSNGPVIQLVEDENTKAIDNASDEIKNSEKTDNDEQTNKEDEQVVLHEKYSVKIGSNIYVKPVTTIIDGKEINIGGWIMLTATQGLMQTSCWVFVDVPVNNLEIDVKNKQNYEIETITTEAEDAEELEQYCISPNDVINLNKIISPVTSVKYPSSSIPPNKNYTNFNLTKNIVYEISNEEIATINSNGKITVNQNKEGQTFTVSAYIISQYNQLSKIPNLQDFVDDPNRDPSQSPEDLYLRAMNKICVRSNKILFKIKEIEIEGLTVGDKSYYIAPYNLFEQGSISFSRNIKNPKKNSFYADLLFSEEIDEGYRDVLIGNIQIAFVMESDAQLEPKEKITELSDIIINNKHIEDAQSYIKYQNINGTWKYVVQQYAANNFYLIFYYQLENETLVYDYLPINLAYVPVENVEVNSEEINLNYGSDPYSLKNFATITPSNSTNNKIMYFVDKSEGIVSVADTTMFITVGNKTLYPVSIEYINSEESTFDYTTLVAEKVGSTKLYSVVLKQIPKFENTEEPLTVTGYEFMQTESDGLQWEYCNDVVTINVIKDVAFNQDLILVDAEELEDIDYEYNYDSYNLYIKMYQNDKVTIKLSYDDDQYQLSHSAIDFEKTQSGLDSIVDVENLNNSELGSYLFDIHSLRVGDTIVRVIYNGSQGPVTKYTIKVTVLSTELVGINLGAQDNLIKLSFTSNNETDNDSIIATGHKWSDINLNVVLNSPKSNAAYELRTYKLPENFESLIDYYAGKDYEEIITDPAVGQFNTIKKLLEYLQRDTTVIAIDNLENRELEYSGFFKIGDKKVGYDFVGTGKILLVAESESQYGISSNPIIIEVTKPEISVVYGSENNTKNYQTVYSQGELDSIENIETPAKLMNITLGGLDTIKFYSTVDGVKYNVGKLIDFKFTQPVMVNSDESAISHAKLIKVNGVYFIRFADINIDLQEKIVAYSNFGYLNNDFYTYYLKPDYKISSNYPTDAFKTPCILDLFSGYVICTNYEFDENNETGNKLFLPNGYINSSNLLNFVNVLKDVYGQNFIDSLYYNDGSGESYYHIYSNLKISNSNISSSSEDYDYRKYENGLIALSYQQNPQSVNVYFETPAGKYLRTQINVQPAVKSTFVYTAGKSFEINASTLSNNHFVEVVGEIFKLPLNDKILFTDYENNPLDETSDFSVNLENAYLTVTNDIDSSLIFYLTENGSKIEGYTLIDQEYYNYIYDSELISKLKDDEYLKTKDEAIITGKLYFEISYQTVSEKKLDELSQYYELNNDEYTKTQDTQIDVDKNYYKRIVEIVSQPIQENLKTYYEINYKKYFIKCVDDNIDVNKKYYIYTNYVKVDNPSQEDIASYYEYINGEFILTTDKSLQQKVYYVDQVKYDYQEVLNPVIADKNKYYNAVYSNEDYYRMIEPKYIEVENKTSLYASLYYEKVYQKVSEEDIVEGKTYYIYQQGNYQIVENPIKEEILNYFEEYFVPISQYNDDGVYYYKQTYELILENECIDDAFYKYTINLVLDKEGDIVTNLYLQLSDKIECLIQSLKITISFKVKILNKVDNYSYSYSGFYYNIIFEGLEG